MVVTRGYRHHRTVGEGRQLVFVCRTESFADHEDERGVSPTIGLSEKGGRIVVRASK
jgi:hypothetical protein